MSETHAPAHFHRERYLFGFSPIGEVMEHVRTYGTPDEIDRLPEIASCWNAIRPDIDAIVAAEAGLCETVEVHELPPDQVEVASSLINAAPLHMRLLAPAGPPDWHPAPEEIRAAARRVIDICRHVGRDVADVALRFCLDHESVATTVIGMARPSEVEQNLATLEMTNDPDLLRAIERAVAPVKNQIWMQGREQNNDPHWQLQ